MAGMTGMTGTGMHVVRFVGVGGLFPGARFSLERVYRVECSCGWASPVGVPPAPSAAALALAHVMSQ